MSSMDADISMSWLHDTLSEEWGAWLGQAHSWSVKKGAYYSLNVSPGLRVISLNMNYCMNKNLWLLINSTDPADQLQWLVYELQARTLTVVKHFIVILANSGGRVSRREGSPPRPHPPRPRGLCQGLEQELRQDHKQIQRDSDSAGEHSVPNFMINPFTDLDVSVLWPHPHGRVSNILR